MLARIPTGENVHDFIEESSTGDSTCGFEKLSIPRQSFETFSVRDDSPKRVDAQDLSEVDTVVAVFQSFCIDKSFIGRDEKVKDSMKVDYSAESSVPRNDDREDTLNVNDTLESSPLRDEGKAMTKVNYNSCTKCPDIEYSSPRQRSSCKNKLDQENKNKRPARSCGKAASKKALLDLRSLQFTRRRRSSLCKQARATVWGLLGNIGPVLEQNGVVDISPKKTYRSRRLRGVQGNGKRENNKKVQNSAKSRGKRFIPTGPISLKVKFGKETACMMNVMTLIDDNKEEDCKAEKSFPELSKDVEYLVQKEAAGSKSFQSSDGNLEKASDMHYAITDSIENPDGNTSDDLWESPFQEEVDKVVVTIDNRISDSGTSPDSEVINLTPDAQINEKDPEVYSHDVSLTDEYLDSENASVSVLSKNANKGKRDNEHHQTGDCSVNGEVPSPENVINVPEFLTLGQTEKVGDVTCVTDTSTSITTENASLNTSNAEGFSKEPPPCPSAACLTISCEMSKFGSGVEANLSPRFGIELQSLESKSSEKLLPCTKGQKLAKNSRARKEIKSSLETSNSSRREKTSKKKGSEDKSPDKRKSKDKGDFNQIRHGVDNHPETGIHALSGVEEAGETGSGNKSLTGGTSQKIMVTVGVVEQYIPPRQAWVCCDDCEKWRRIPAVLADQINESRCSWVCKDNMDKNFADCSIPQEKSNAEINAELDISDASCEEDACDRLDSNKLRQKQLTVTQQAPWMRIKSNMFLHRRRKAQTIDEIMVCHCKPPSEGRVGCGDGCLNRMLNIECIQGTCPCGEFCSNQQFQKRKYAKLNSVKCGKKGHGLRLLEDVSEGQFLIEYVGEVLDMHAHEARQRDYAVKGHKHFYFMTLNGSEVIDACTKGNLGRFINHSCDPNCRTEKWMVNGEVCIGIFALRDIKKGEEVTFDYNYVRVFGAAAKKCVCGSSQCRGYIGGDPLNAEIIVQSDSDEEYPEPVIVRGNGEMNRNLSYTISVTSSINSKETRTIKEPLEVEDHMDGSISTNGKMDISSEKQTREMSYQDKFSIDGSTTAAGCLEITKGSGDSNLSASTALNSIYLEKESSIGQHSPVGLVGTSPQSGVITSENMSAAPEECSATEKCLDNPLCSNQGSNANSLYEMSDKVDSKKNLKFNVQEDGVVLSKSHARTKTSKTSSSVKKGKPKTNSVDTKKPLEIDNKTHVTPFKPKRLLEDLSNGRYEAVQEKLNELLDNDGGISKRKDASRGYLKLLLLTAASGDSGNGEAIQSNRDLSMILDAFLKTKSRTVLVDIINKNGLQMLHNIMKRYRKEFIKIPILRKLLKVLEYLATREILTSEHINGGPRCPGVESFRDSILTLTEHSDKQVHQIARNFRDRWIPRCFRKFGCIDRDHWRKEFYQSPKHDRSLSSHTNSSDCAGIPSETPDCIAKPVVASNTVDAAGPDVSCESRRTRKRKSRWDQPSTESPDLGAETNMAGDGAHSMDEDVPPGFPCPLNRPMLPSDAYVNDIDRKNGRTGDAKCPYGVAMGYSQQRFISRFSVAYGVPMSIAQQFGTYQAETSENWSVAPGMPFQPFPPLPPYPRDKSKDSAMSQVGQNVEQDSHNRATLDSSQNPPSTSRAIAVGKESIGGINQPDLRQDRGTQNLVRNYFRQQKWNSSVAGAPWIQKRNGWGSVVNNSRNGMCQESLGSGCNELNTSYSSEDMSTSTQGEVTFH